ncbi:MAG: aminotransferase class V-fold PLP-dependent enzyme [Anaerolineales bacterium]|nr:aminotransferase class V-fold PLP-dependent enzyme [Anaerolineales bacterium]
MSHTIAAHATLSPAGALSLPEAEAEFRRAYPEYEQTRVLDELRNTEYARLDRGGHIYLDYTGGGLYAESQVREHQQWLLSGVFGNPHSSNPTSLAATERVENTRHLILEFFNADPREYVAIFTANASGALKLVGESYPFAPGGQFLLTFDNHNSVNGIREFARAKGARVTYTPVLPPDLRIDAAKLEANLQSSNLQSSNPQSSNLHPRLFAYPAQSNFSGVQHSLDWVARAQALGWDVLLDAAAFVPTNRLDLSAVRPDFVSLSFYKIFGYPTGTGALIARRAALKKLKRPWFAGGTVEVASVQGDRFYLHEGAEAFEDGTLDYLMLPAVEIGLRHIRRIGVDVIHTRVMCLTDWLLRQLTGLRHANGAPLVRIYGPTTTEARGGTVTFNLFDPERRFFDHRLVERRAGAAHISLRTGCFCNPGGNELALGISAEELTACFVTHDRMTLDEFRRCIDDKSTGAVRVSLGLASTFADVYRFVEFARSFLDKRADENGSPRLW